MSTGNKKSVGISPLFGKPGSHLKFEIKNKAVTNAKLADNAVTTDKIADKSITPDKLSNDVIKNKAEEWVREWVAELTQIWYETIVEPLPSNLAQEIIDRTQADENLTDALNAEKERAIAAEEDTQNDLTTEETRAQLAEGVLDGRIDQEIIDRIADVNAEEIRAKAAESDLQDAIAIEKTRAEGIESDLQDAIDAEETRAQTAEGNLNTKINQEITNRINDVNTEETRATTVENNLSDRITQEISNREADVNAEETRAKAAEKTNSDALTAEVTRATTKENNLDTRLEAEITRSTDKDTSHDSLITGLRTDLTTETNTRTTQVESINTWLAKTVCGGEYDSTTKKIVMKDKNGEALFYIDAAAFIKDGMVSNVAINNGNLVVTFNTDSGHEPISIALTDIFNPSNYYTKTQVDTKVKNITDLIPSEASSTNKLADKNYVDNIQEQSDWNVSDSTSVSFIKNKPTIPSLSGYATQAWVQNQNYLTEHQSLSAYALKSELFSGNYNDLTNKPTIPSLNGYATQSWVQNQGYLTEHQSLSNYALKSELFSGNYNDLTNKPTIPTVPTKVSAFTNDAGYLTEHQSLANYALKSELFSGDYNDLSNKPTIPSLSGYATQTWVQNQNYLTEHQSLTNYALKSELFSGNYNDLTNKPTIPTVPTKVSAFTNDAGYLTEHQSLANYALKSELFSGSYNDLTDKPTIPSLTGYATQQWVQNQGYLTNHQSLEAYALKSQLFSGNYNDLTNKPTIPDAQIQSDWNQTNTTAKDYIKNKPTIPTVPTKVSAFTNDAGYLTSHQDISGKANTSDLATVATSGSYNDLSNKPTIPTVPTNVSAFNNDAGYLTANSTAIAKNIIVSKKAITGNTTASCSITGSDYSGYDETIVYTNSTSTDYTVTIPTTYKTPGNLQMVLKCVAGGYCEVNFLNINGVVFGRGL